MSRNYSGNIRKAVYVIFISLLAAWFILILLIASITLFTMFMMCFLIDEFPVCVLPTPLSRSFGLCSNHVLKVSESDFHLYDASGTTPTSFICLLSNIENVALDETRGVGSGTISLHCTK